MIITDETKLRHECKNVSLIEAPAIIDKLSKELISHGGGVGLAANQIGIDAKVAIIKFKTQIALVNPTPINAYDLLEFHYEACLSFPSKNLTTKRYNEIFIRDDFHPAGMILIGFEAVIAQHEIGHLYGETMFDYEIKIPGMNEPCWCGSGKKYKKCHYEKEIKL
jgi:peptide deformylase